MEDIRPNYQDFEVELEALNTTHTDEKDHAEKHTKIREGIKVSENFQNRI